MVYIEIGTWIMGPLWVVTQFLVFIKPVRDWWNDDLPFDDTVANETFKFWRDVLDDGGLDDDFEFVDFLAAMVGHVAIAFVSGLAGFLGIILWPVIPFMAFFGLIYLLFIYLPRNRSKERNIEIDELNIHQTNVFSSNLTEGNVISNTKPTPKNPKPKIKDAPTKSKFKFKKIKLKK